MGHFPKCAPGEIQKGAAVIAGAITSAPLLADFFGYFLVQQQESTIFRILFFPYWQNRRRTANSRPYKRYGTFSLKRGCSYGQSGGLSLRVLWQPFGKFAPGFSIVHRTIYIGTQAPVF